jgi:hypothetical protein
MVGRRPERQGQTKEEAPSARPAQETGTRGRVAPGWQKKVARGEVLDADLYRQSRSLPDDLLDRLTDLPDGTEVRLLDDRAVRVINDTRLILDVLSLY